MAEYPDDYEPITITIQAQGIGTVTNIVPTPNPANGGETVGVIDTITNTALSGVPDEFFWVKNFVDGAQVGSTYISAAIPSGGSFTVSWSFTMPHAANAQILVQAGHMIGTYPNWSESPMDSQLPIPVYCLPQGAFVGLPVYDNLVEPPAVVTIDFQIQNIGGNGINGAGDIFCGVYDYAIPTPNLVQGQYWTTQLPNSTPVSHTFTLNVTEAMSVQLIVGHFED